MSMRLYQWAYERGKEAERNRIRRVIHDYRMHMARQWDEYDTMRRDPKTEKEALELRKRRMDINTEVDRILDGITKPVEKYMEYGPAPLDDDNA